MKKNNHPRWAVPLTGALLLGAGVTASAQPAQQYPGVEYPALVNTNRVTLSLRFGLNISTKFSGVGSAGGSGHYSDGYVLRDSTGNYLGYTSNWGYDNAGQYSQLGTVNQPANSFAFHNPVASARSTSPSSGDNPNVGVELKYNRQLGVKENWHNLRYGIEGAFNYMKISADSNSGYNTSATTENYLFGGIAGQQPQPGYRGHYNGDPGSPVLFANQTGDPNLTVPNALLQTHDDFNADLWGGRIGPYIELPFGKQQQFTLSLSGGLALGLINANESWKQTLTLAGGGGGTTSGGGSDTSLFWGWYAAVTANYQFDRHWGVAAGVQFQDLGTYDHSFGGRHAQIDLSQSVFLTVGVSYGW
jgi:hypothetical protein